MSRKIGMRRFISLLLAFLCISILAGCLRQTAKTSGTVDGNLKTYYGMSDGTWQADGHIYEYRLEITGSMPGSGESVTYVCLSNTQDISFEKAMMASGLGSNTGDYFPVEDALLVEIR